MSTHLIKFFRQKTGAPVSAVIVDVDATDAACRARAYADARDPACPCCCDHARKQMAVERAYMLELVPKDVKVRADVYDVTGDHRVCAEHKGRKLKQSDQLVRDLVETAPPASTRH